MDNEMKKKFEIKISEIELIKDLISEKSEDFYIYSVSSIKNPHSNTLLFTNIDMEFSKLTNCLIIVNENINTSNNLNNNLFIKSTNPRLEYAKILKYILNKQKNIPKYTLMPGGYYIGENVQIGENNIIEPMVLIDSDVVIGNNCNIKCGAKIRKYTKIGNGCIVKENCVIGSSGFGVEKDTNGNVEKIPHLGGVLIKDKVEIGALASIASGTIEPTIIEDNVKIDDCAFIAHNCHVGKSTFVIANAEISGSVIIGENCWIGPNSSIRQKLHIGNNSLIGIGSVVTKNISENCVVAGNPAEDIEKIKRRRKTEKSIIY